MNLLLIFALILISIVFGIFLQRIIHSPILVGLLFFTVFVLIYAITSDTTFIILSAILAAIAFISAFLDCLISSYGIFRNSNCLRPSNTNGNNSSNNNDNRLTVLNSNGEIIARINGDNVTYTANANINGNGSGNNNVIPPCGCNSCRR